MTKTKKWILRILSAVLVVPTLVLLFYHSSFSSLAVCWWFFIAVFCLCLAASLISTTTVSLPSSSSGGAITRQLPMHDLMAGLPLIPQTLIALQAMHDDDFEVLSAAVIIALGQGHTFHSMGGASADEGIDVRLYNHIQQLVIVQCKRQAAHVTVGQPVVMQFLGTIQHHHAAYGYFMTSSTFTAGAQRVITDSHGRIRGYDGQQIEHLLHHRAREVRLALRDIYKSIGDNPGQGG